MLSLYSQGHLPLSPPRPHISSDSSLTNQAFFPSLSKSCSASARASAISLSGCAADRCPSPSPFSAQRLRPPCLLAVSFELLSVAAQVGLPAGALPVLPVAARRCHSSERKCSSVRLALPWALPRAAMGMRARTPSAPWPCPRGQQRRRRRRGAARPGLGGERSWLRRLCRGRAGRGGAAAVLRQTAN